MTLERLADNIFYDKAVFEIRDSMEASVRTVVNNRPVRLDVSEVEEQGRRGSLLVIRTDDPVPFSVQIKKPSGVTMEGMGFFINGRENDGYSEYGDGLLIDRVWTGKTVVKIIW